VVAAVPPALPLRWAALFHDIGKPQTFTLDEAGCGHFYGHAAVSAEIADTVLRRLKAPNELRQQVVTLVKQHMSYAEPDQKMLRRWLSRLGEQTLQQLLALQEADTCSKGVISAKEQNFFLQIKNILDELLSENACLKLKDLAVNGHDLMALGYSGRQIGTILNKMLDAVLDEQVENNKQALLALLPHITEKD
jgi:tRNA nucleotidyltransferase (CCA-adding enzyme)